MCITGSCTLFLARPSVPRFLDLPLPTRPHPRTAHVHQPLLILPPASNPLQVLYSKFGFMYTDIKLNGEDYILIREEDVIGIMPRTSEWSAEA